MNKPRKYGWVVTLVLLAAVVWVIVESRRPPDYTAAALKRLPEACNRIGTWRNDDYPEAIKGMRNTIVMCDAPQGRKVWTVPDSGTPFSVLIDATGFAPSTHADTYVVNADGSLTISDEQGVVLQLPPN